MSSRAKRKRLRKASDTLARLRPFGPGDYADALMTKLAASLQIPVDVLMGSLPKDSIRVQTIRRLSTARGSANLDADYGCDLSSLMGKP